MGTVFDPHDPKFIEKIMAYTAKKSGPSNKMATRGTRSGPKVLPSSENVARIKLAAKMNEQKKKSALARAKTLAGTRLKGTGVQGYFPYNISVNTLGDIQKLSTNWKVQPSTVAQYIAKQIQNHGVRNKENLAVFVRELARASNYLTDKKIKAVISSLGRGETTFLNPAAGADPNKLSKFREAIGGAVTDDVLRKFTPSLRQAHGGSRLETFAVALGARVAGKTVLTFSTEKNSPPFNFNKVNGAPTGSEITQIWSNPVYQSKLPNGIFVLKSKFNLAVLKNAETNPYFQNLMFRLVKTNAVGPGKPAYINQTAYNRPGPLSRLKGKNAETSVWKGFDACEPDVLYFYIDENGCLHILIYEFKVGLGKAESVPAEYFQLVKAKRVLEKLFGPLVGTPGGPPCLIIEMFFFPFKYASEAETAPNFAHPSRFNLWKNNWEKLSNNTKLKSNWRPRPGASVLAAVPNSFGPYTVQVINRADFERQTGVNVKVLETNLAVTSLRELGAIKRSVRSQTRRGYAVPRGPNATSAATAALVELEKQTTGKFTNTAANRKRYLKMIQRGSQVPYGTNYTAGLMALGGGVSFDKEIPVALQQLAASGFVLKKGNNKMTINKMFEGYLPERNNTLSSGTTWSGVNRGRPGNIAKSLARIKAAYQVSMAPPGGAVLGAWPMVLKQKLPGWEFVPNNSMNVNAGGASATAANAKAALARVNAERILNIANSNNTNATRFETLYGQFLATHGGDAGGIMKAFIRNKGNREMNNTMKSYYAELLRRAAAVPVP